MEFDAGPQFERIDLAVVRDRPALGQRGQDLAARADPGQALEDVRVKHLVDCRGGAGRRVQMRRLQRHAKDEIGPRRHGGRGGGKRQTRCCEDRFPELHGAISLATAFADSCVYQGTGQNQVRPNSLRSHAASVT
jgi:hypothetical protein